MTKESEAPELDENEENIDGCDLEFHDEDALPDEELPIAVGGVAIENEGDDACGCDVDFDDMDATPDDQLPTAEGGVA